MNNNSIYTSIITAKNGTEIPMFSNGRTVDSKYNPEREAESLIATKLSQPEYKDLDEVNSSIFFVVIGIGSGTLIEKLLNKFPESTILGLEISNNDLLFLNNLKKIKKLKENKNIILSHIDNLGKDLINNYLPALYDDFKIIEQRGWMEENKNHIDKITKIINKSIGIISADFSVQAHFGKIWQSNIINNLKTLSHNKNVDFSFTTENKIAAIVAAGPSLDNSIEKIKSNINKYFIIGTDTSLPVLIGNNISPDIIISIDGQHISHNHFSKCHKCKKTLFFLDLCSDYSVANFLSTNNYNVSFFITGHPLSLVANQMCNNKMPELFSGAGTVTISALDLAFKLGFSDIEIFGADFSYSKGKAYTKGTYFDTIFNINNSKVNTTEQQYAKLMYRTELLKLSKNEYSTRVLAAYKLSLEEYLADNKCIFLKEDFIYKIKHTISQKNRRIFNLQSFSYDFDDFIANIKKSDLEELKYPLLPYVAWLKNKTNSKSLKLIALLKLAQSNIVRYN